MSKEDKVKTNYFLQDVRAFWQRWANVRGVVALAGGLMAVTGLVTLAVSTPLGLFLAFVGTGFFAAFYGLQTVAMSGADPSTPEVCPVPRSWPFADDQDGDTLTQRVLSWFRRFKNVRGAAAVVGLTLVPLGITMGGAGVMLSLLGAGFAGLMVACQSIVESHYTYPSRWPFALRRGPSLRYDSKTETYSLSTDNESAVKAHQKRLAAIELASEKPEWTCTAEERARMSF